MFQHLLNVLHGKPFSFRHNDKDKDKSNDSNAAKYQEGECSPNGICESQEGLGHNQITDPHCSGCYPSTCSSVSQRIELRVDNPWHSSHSRREEEDIQTKSQYGQPTSLAGTSLCVPVPTLCIALLLCVVIGRQTCPRHELHNNNLQFLE